MITLVAITLFMIFLLISLLHVYWAIGGEWASNAVLPTKEDDRTKVLDPAPFPTFMVAIGLLGFGYIALESKNLTPFTTPHWLHQNGLYFIIAIFGLRAIGDFHYVGFFKKIKRTEFGRNDSYYFSPLCVLICILAIILKCN